MDLIKKLNKILYKACDFTRFFFKGGEIIDLLKLIDDFKMFFQGALDLKSHSLNHIEDEIKETNDEFLILAFGDLLGIDMPTSYYALELLPYLVEELEDFEKRMNDKKSVWEQKGANLDMDP